jgi:peptidoglycan L-alanyl-D-glutamate endopeptidase CwlK
MSKEDVNRDITLLKPEMQEMVNKIYRDIIVFNRLPIELFEGIRTQERQQWLFDQGYSKTLNSRHFDGSAVDFVYCVDGHWSWDNYTLHYIEFLGKRVMELYPDKLVWGGSWITFVDKFHFELRK